MKLKPYTQSLEEKMTEFDLWITPSLGEIRDTNQFLLNQNRLLYGFDLLSELTDVFASANACHPSILSERVIQKVNAAPLPERKPMLEAICNVLLLATGKTDNNLKCQYPQQLQNVHHITCYPYHTSRNQWKEKSVPRTFGIEEVTNAILQMQGKEAFQTLFAKTYFQLILSDAVYVNQLWNLGNAYCHAREYGDAASFLAPIVVFQSRGSITATQGHIPENMLRTFLLELGLLPDYDFNTQDVEVGDLLADTVTDTRLKKRKYDFILPYQSRPCGQRIFIQSQFYGGDSGSVSHKVVDQTDSTRKATLQKYPDAVFLEYLDGAGYFASLNGDLRKMLAKPTTKEFFQIRTAPIKLRRELQAIGFLTPLEVEHAILRTSGDLSAVTGLLQQEGYAPEEIQTVISQALEHHRLSSTGNTLVIRYERYSTVRRCCLLDTVANCGFLLPNLPEREYLLIPGYGVAYGIPYGYLVASACELFPRLPSIQTDQESLADDIMYLLQKGLLKKTGREI